MTTEQHNSDQSKTKLWICIMMKAPFENGIGSIKNIDEEKYLKLIYRIKSHNAKVKN